ncbi:cytochrome P450 [Streptomyces nigrescens]|uniref:cytochrome P450 n=1 Tax=Streptomyces nigrescens TaxID=1920 RepID=UPI0036F5C4EC
MQSSTAPTSSLRLFDDRVLADPYPTYEALRNTGPAMHLEEYDVWAIPRHADLAAILKDPGAFGSADGIALTYFANHQVLAGTVLAADGDAHTRLRRVLHQQLGYRTMKLLTRRINDRAERLVDQYTASGRFDALALVRHMVCDTVMELMGLPGADRALLLDGAAATFDVFGPANERHLKALPLASRMAQTLREQLTRKTVTPGSWMDAIFQAVDAGQITEQDAVPLASAYTAASIDTTVLGLTDTLVQLARHPQQWQLLRRDPDHWATHAFHESLRLEAPIQGFGRLLTEPADVGGVHLEEGEQVWLLYGSAGRDPERWGSDADTYDLQRPGNRGHLAFGGGPHLCAGIPLAELQARAVLRALATRCSHLTLDGEPVRVLNNLLRGYGAAPLAVELSPRTSASGRTPEPCRQGPVP